MVAILSKFRVVCIQARIYKLGLLLDTKFEQSGIKKWTRRSHYATNFGEVEGAYWFGPVRPSVCP